MKFSVPVEILAARIASVQLKVDHNGAPQTTLKLEGVMTPELAAALGCATALYAGETPRGGFESVALGKGTFCMAFQGRLEPLGHGMAKHALTITGDQVDTWVITREAPVSDALLLVSCKLHLQGHVFDVLEYLNVIGRGPGLCRITPSQADLIEAADKKAAEEDRVTIAMDGKTLFDGTAAEFEKAAQSLKIPSNPNAPEWRTADEIRDGVPHHIVRERVN